MSEQTNRAMEERMATSQELAVREKRELAGRDERTVPGRLYVPYADIYETAQ